ncbi:MAG: efflux RND transporter permease subunit [Acidobacteriota bacterium]
MSLSELPIRRPVGTLMLLVSLLVLGLVAIPRLPLDFMPAVERPFVHVEVPFPGSHPLEGLRQLVEPLEDELAMISGVTALTARSEPGKVDLTVRFSWSADLDLKKMEVRAAVDRARRELPDSIGHIAIRTFKDGPGDGAILQGRISARRDLSRSYELLDRRIRRPLERVKGVASVRLDGVNPQEVRIDLDPVALLHHGITAVEVFRSLQEGNADLDLGEVHGDGLRYMIRSLARFRDLETIRTLALGRKDLRVGDVAQVSLREPELTYGRHLDGKFAIGIDVLKEPTANTVETVDRLMERIESIRADPELQGINLLVWLNQAQEIRASLAGLRNAGLYGGGLAVLVLFLFLRRLSTTLIVAAAIPFSLIVACGLMYLMGTVLNVLTMLGLMVGVGMLVDNAVVVSENIHRHQALGESSAEATLRGAREVFLAVLAATATTVIVWSWLFTIEPDEMYIYIGAVALTLCLAVACSLLISLTFIPLAAAHLTPRRAKGAGFALRRIIPGYRSLLGWTLRHRLVALTALVLLAGSAAIPILAIEKSGDPKEVEREVSIFYRPHDPTDKTTMERHVDTVEAWLASRRGDLGQSHVYSYYQQDGFAMTRVYLPWTKVREAAIRDLREKLKSDLPVIAGVDLEVGDREGFHRGRSDRRIVPVALHGEDPEYLREIASRVEQRLQGIEGAKEVFGPSLRGQLEARVLVDSEKARALGLTPRQVAETVAFTYRGRPLRRYAGPGGEVEMLLGLPDDRQPGLASLASLALPRQGAEPVPLASVAALARDRTERAIDREDRRTTQWVNVEFDPSVTTEVARKRVDEGMDGIVLPEGYSWSHGHWGEDRDDALAIMMKGIVLSLVLVLLLMAALFESILQPFAIFITLPLAFFGAFWALWLLGYELEIVAFVGVIILIGMVVNNGIVMVDHVNHLRREGRGRMDALLEGCGDRLRPILMTTITTVFGLVPLAMSRFAVAGVYVDSMAVAIIGGLASSTVFTLLALPVWYTLVEDAGSVVLRSLPRSRRTLAAPGAGGL